MNNVGREVWDVPELDVIDATLTRTGRWWITYPCGGHTELNITATTREVRLVIRQHVASCGHCLRERPKIVATGTEGRIRL
jgi:hypothetical protein